MLFVRIFLNKLFTFSVSNLTIFQSWFLRDGNNTFSDMIFFFINTTSFISSFVYIDVIDCVVMFRFSEFYIIRMFFFSIFFTSYLSIYFYYVEVRKTALF